MTEADLQYLPAPLLKQWIHDQDELALLDIREHGQYGENHLFFAVPLPYSVLELDINRLVPSRQTRIVIYADDSNPHIVPAAARALARLGYTQVYALKGGIAAWQQSGYAVFAGVNLPSKTFGEIAEHVYGTPSVSATALQTMLVDTGADVVVVDGRPVEEYRKMNIPGAISCPNGELALRINELVPNPDTTIVVNCAGRTRSIVGAQTLINLGLPNKIYALENGTQGWFLADLPLEHQSNRIYPDAISDASRPLLRQRADRLIEKFDLHTVDLAQVQAWLTDEQRNVFFCDVRTRQEHTDDDLPACIQHTPGGQLVQATDQYIGVRKAKVVICDFDGIRAPVAASWLKQLGWDVVLLSDPHRLTGLSRPVSPDFASTLAHTVELESIELARFMAQAPEPLVFDTRASMAYRANHLSGSTWTIRPTLAAQVGQRLNQPILLLGTSLNKLRLLAGDLEEHGCTQIFICAATDQVLRDTGLPMEQTEFNPPDAACIDYLFFVHDRHDGNKAAARKYLEWETNLVSQLDEQERNTFRINP